MAGPQSLCLSSCQRVPAAALLGLWLGAADALYADVSRSEACESEAEATGGATLSLLQSQLQFSPSTLKSAPASAPALKGWQNMVFMHIPFNFGHTVEKVAAYGSGAGTRTEFNLTLQSLGSWSGMEQPSMEQLPPVPGLAWGHLNPMLQVISNTTGCPMYYTPPKYWPEDLARRYFGSGNQIFANLRDPYERLVAFFRGHSSGYGAGTLNTEFKETCDVNGAVKHMLKMYLASDSKFINSCSLLPQAEFFEGPHGVSLPVDNRQFPASMNRVLAEHGYANMTIHTEDIMHVHDCNEVWPADLDDETRAMVRHIYKRDFELLCKYFGYCDDEENACVWQVPQMCPQRVLDAGYRGRKIETHLAAPSA